MIKYVCQSDNNIQDLLISSLFNDLMDHARKLKFSSYVHVPSINKMFQYYYA